MSAGWKPCDTAGWKPALLPDYSKNEMLPFRGRDWNLATTNVLRFWRREAMDILRTLAHKEGKMISVKQLTKRFGTQVAVDELSFEIPAGQIVGFLGPNGAGKSTTLKMLTGMIEPTSGTATISGYD